jgi:hypothetical protein
MRLPSLFLTLCLLLAAPAVAVLRAADPVPAGLSVSMSFSPSPSNPDGYVCSAEVTDLATSAVLARPQILGLKGEPGRAQIGDDHSSLVLDVLVDKTGTRGTYTVTYSKTGKVVAIQKGSLSLR